MLDLSEYIMEKMSSKNCEFVECRQESTKNLSMVFNESGPKELTFNEDAGLSLRLLKDGLWFFTAISNPKKSSVDSILKQGFFNAKPPFKRRLQLYDTPSLNDAVYIKVDKSLLNIGVEEISQIPLSAYRELNSYLKGEYAFVKSFNILFNACYREETYTNNLGSKITQAYPFNRFVVNLTGLLNGKRARTVETVGGVKGLEAFKKDKRWDTQRLIARSLERIKSALQAGDPPRGSVPVVMDPSMTGTLIHEAFGHMCEADMVMAGGVITPKHLNKKVAAESVSIIDDPINLDGGWVPYDQEGVKGEKSILVEQGVLKSFLVNREYGALLDQRPKGNARATNYHYPPIIRMRNTYLKPGDYSFEELIEDVERGIYVEKFIGGQASLLGAFQFSSQIGWLIEKGEITRPLKDVSISGSTFDTLQTMDAIGKNFETDIGTCGKGQWVIVGDGGPAVRIPNLRVGGI